MIARFVVCAAFLLAPAAPAALAAQQPLPAGARPVRTGWQAAGVEALGGSIGAAAGYGLVAAVADDCHEDGDLVSCFLGPAIAALGASTIGATAGTIIAGRSSHTDVSTPGAIVGAVAGAFVALAVHHLVTEEMGWRVNKAGTTVIVGVSQGITTALGSRLFAALRKR